LSQIFSKSAKIKQISTK